MRVTSALALGWLTVAPSAAGPHVAHIGNVAVHSNSLETKIMVTDLASGEAVNVSEGLHSARSPAWSPEASKLAFEAIEEGLCDIFVCSPDGTSRVNVTATLDEWEFKPCFVDEGRLAYLSGPDRSDIWIIDLETKEKRKLTDRPLFYKAPAASPDGSLLAVTGAEKLAGPGHIYLVRTDGSGSSTLTAARAIYSAPVFSPDGSSIAFCFDQSDVGGATRGVAIMPVEGGEPTLLAQDGYPLAPLCFSADGGKIAYTSSSCYHSTWVNLMNADGTENVRLEVGRAHIIAWPSFSPDGGSLAYQAVYAARCTVRLFDIGTGNDSMLTPEGETGVNPVFSPR